MPATKNAPAYGVAAPGEGEDQNPRKEPIMNDATSVPLATDIHPEIPRPSWATARYEDDHGRLIVDERKYRDGKYTVTREITHEIGGVTRPENLLITWRTIYPDESGTDFNEACILPDDLPDLIAFLQRLQAEVTR